MSTTFTESCFRTPASTELSSMSIALKSEAPTVAFRKRRHKPKRQANIRYEPYLEAVIQRPSRSKLLISDEIEEGEIVEEVAPSTNLTNRNSSSPAKVARQEFVQHIQQLRMIDEPCATFCTTGTCTSICPRIHDQNKTTICPTILQQQPCKEFKKGKCNLTHEWNFHVAPSCIGYLLGICYTVPCCFAHNDHVCAFSAHCEQFKVLGYCEKGAECDRIHLVGALPPVIIKNQLEEKARKLKEAKQKAKLSYLIKKQLPTPDSSKPASPVSERPSTGRRSLGDSVWSEEVEVVLGGEKKGELALQEDFVPFG